MLPPITTNSRSSSAAAEAMPRPTPSPAVRKSSLASASPWRAAAAMSAADDPGARLVVAPDARASVNRRASPEPEDTPSTQPRAPQPHSGPFGQTMMWPTWPLLPAKPCSSWPPRMIPPPTPVETTMPSMLSEPRPAPCQRSPRARALASLSTTTGRSKASARRALSGKSRHSGTFDGLTMFNGLTTPSG